VVCCNNFVFVVFNPQPEPETATGLTQDASSAPSGVVVERRRRRRRYRRRQTPTAQLVARLTELTSRLQSSAEAAQPPAFSKSTVDAEVQCDLVEAPPLKQRRRQVNVVAGIQQTVATTPVAAPTPTVAAPPTTSPTTITQPPTTGPQDFAFSQHAANLIYQELHPVTLDVPQTTWILPGTVTGSPVYEHLPPMVPPPSPIDLQPSTSGVSVKVSPTSHVEAPDDITTSDDDWDPYSNSDSSQDEDFPEIQPMAADVFLRTLQHGHKDP
jgi:hypothetical protein